MALEALEVRPIVDWFDGGVACHLAGCRSLGSRRLRGVREPMELFTP